MIAFSATLLLVSALYTGVLRWARPPTGLSRLGARLPIKWTRVAQVRLETAGRGQAWEAGAWLVVRCGLAVLATATGFVVSCWLPGSLSPAVAGSGAGLAGWLLPSLVLAAEVGQRQRRLLADLPEALDLLALAISGGLDLYAALAETASLAPPGPLQAELSVAARHVALGAPPEQALERLADRTGVSALAALSAAIARARWLGAPLEQVLWAQAEALRQELRHNLEGRLGTLPLRLTLVTLFFFLPPLLLVVLLPGVLSLLGSW